MGDVKNMITEQLVTYEVAKLARQRGFNEPCLFYYDAEGVLHTSYAYDPTNSGVGVYELEMCNDQLCRGITTPTQSLLQRWLREEKALHIQITLWGKGWYYEIWAFEYYEEEKEYSTKMLYQSSDFATHELALEDALKYALENLV